MQVVKIGVFKYATMPCALQCAFYMVTCSYQNWTYQKIWFLLKNTCLTCVGHVQGMWDPHQSNSWPQKPLFRVQDHQNWSRNTRDMGGPLNGPCLQNFMILDAFRYRVNSDKKCTDSIDWNNVMKRNRIFKSLQVCVAW